MSSMIYMLRGVSKVFLFTFRKRNPNSNISKNKEDKNEVRKTGLNSGLDPWPRQNPESKVDCFFFKNFATQREIFEKISLCKTWKRFLQRPRHSRILPRKEKSLKRFQLSLQKLTKLECFFSKPPPLMNFAKRPGQNFKIGIKNLFAKLKTFLFKNDIHEFHQTFLQNSFQENSFEKISLWRTWKPDFFFKTDMIQEFCDANRNLWRFLFAKLENFFSKTVIYDFCQTTQDKNLWKLSSTVPPPCWIQPNTTVK